MLFGTSDNNKRSNDLVDPRLDNVLSHTDSPQGIPQRVSFIFRSSSSTSYSTVNPSRGSGSYTVRVAAGDSGGDWNGPVVTRVVAQVIVVGGLVLALLACSTTRVIDIICPPAGQCPNTRSGHGGGY
jgi:hypothetical protein